MQIDETKCLVKASDKFLCLFIQNGSLYYCSFMNKHWQKSVVIASGGITNFTCTTSGDNIYVFYQDNTGNIWIWESSNSKKRIIQTSENTEVRPIKFCGIVNNKKMDLVYSLAKDDKTYLMANTQNASKWTISEIDEIEAFNGTPFVIQQIRNLNIVYYRTSAGIGYREFSPAQNKWSSFSVFHQTDAELLDQVFLTTPDSLHCIMLLKTKIGLQTGLQLVYRQKNSSGFNNPILLFESSKISNINLFILEERVWVTFSVGNDFYNQISNDGGRTFPRASKYRGEIYEPERVRYLSTSTQDASKLFVSNIYTQPSNPTEVLLFPDLYPAFYTLSVVPQTPTTREMVDDYVKMQSQISFEKMASKYKIPFDQNYRVEAEKLSDELRKVESRINHYQNLLGSKNHELQTLEQSWRNKFESLQFDLQELVTEKEMVLKKFLALQAENSKLKKLIGTDVDTSDETQE